MSTDVPLRLLLVTGSARNPNPALAGLGSECPGLQLLVVTDPESLARVLRTDGFDLAVADERVRWINPSELSLAIRSRHPDCPLLLIRSDHLQTKTHDELASQDGNLIVSPRDFVRLVTEIRTALVRSEGRFSTVFRTCPAAIGIGTIAEGRLIEVNECYAELFGRRREEMVGRRVNELGLWADPRERKALIRRLEEGKAIRDVEVRLRRKSGDLRQALVSMDVIQLRDEAVLVTMLTDITERKQAEESLRESERRYRDLIDSAPIGIFRSTPDGRFLSGNAAFTQMLGYESAEEILALDIPRDVYLDSADRARVMAHFEPTGRIENVEVRLKRKDGSLLWVEASARMVKGNSGGEVCFEVFARDITKRKGMEGELRASEERYRLVQRATDDTVWDWNLLTDEATWSERVTRFGTPPGEVKPNVTWWYDHLHPKDRERVVAGVRSFIASGKEIWSDEYRYRSSDGKYALVADRGYIVRDENGRPVRMIGTMQDITERKSLEAERIQILESERTARAVTEQALGRLQAIQSVTDAALAHLSLENLLKELLSRLCAILAADTGAVLLLSEDGTQLTIRASQGLGDRRAKNRRIPMGKGVAGTIARRREPMVVEDLSQAEVVQGAPRRRVKSLVGAPLLVEGRVVGVLHVGTRRPRHFTDEDVALLQVVADRVAPVIDRARLFEELRDGRERLQALSRRLVDLQEAERHRVARELHDDVGQQLTALKLMIEAMDHLKARRGPASPRRAGSRGRGRQRGVKAAPSTSRKEEMKSVVNDLLARVRDLSMNLRPPMLDDLGLLPALLWHFERYTTQTGVRVNFRQAGLNRRFPPDVETAGFRIVQEALTNVARHAGVSRVKVEIRADRRRFSVEVEDRGGGFDPEAVLSSPSSGLAGMVERARLLGGQLRILSRPGSGTQLRAELPLPSEPVRATGPRRGPERPEHGAHSTREFRHRRREGSPPAMRRSTRQGDPEQGRTRTRRAGRDPPTSTLRNPAQSRFRRDAPINT